MTLDLAIIIVNYRTPELVVNCLESLLVDKPAERFRIVVVDNKSNDGSAKIIQDWITNRECGSFVILIESAVNSGFSGGNNAGIKSVKAEYYLLLNSDTLVQPGAIQSLLSAIQENPEFGLFSPRLEWEDGSPQESCFRFPGPLSEFLAAAQTGAVTKVLSKYVVAMPVQAERMMPQWTSFACVMIRGAVFEQVGLMDEEFFMYFEDIEFCHRARKAGWHILHCPDARVVHLRGGSAPVKQRTIAKRRLPRYYYESRARYFYLKCGWLGLLSANLLWWAGRGISLIRQLLGRSDKSAVQYMWLDIWTNWTWPVRKYTHPESKPD